MIDVLQGADIVDKVIVGTATWSELFAKHDFFHKYRYYLQIIASTGDPALQIKWYVDIIFSYNVILTATVVGLVLSNHGCGSWS